MNFKNLLTGLALIFMSGIFSSCRDAEYENIPSNGRTPVIEPDYSGVTIPNNIAPMNFTVLEEGVRYHITLSAPDGTKATTESSDGKVKIPLKEWKDILGRSSGDTIKIEVTSESKEGTIEKFDPFSIFVSQSSVDPWLCYRLLYPGYESWVEMQIILRSTENFDESSLVDNKLLEGNCVNCHSFNKNRPDSFLVHVRGSKGGTYFYDGKNLKRTMLRTDKMTANAVYPAWHPSGKYVAFSSNKTVQSFHMKSGKNIEVMDLYSSMLIYDVEKNGMFDFNDDDTVKYMETFPCWSPDGEYLYYCRTFQVKEDAISCPFEINKGYDEKNRKGDSDFVP